jgi:hypothetical protein
VGVHVLDGDDEEVKSLVTAWRLSRLVSSIGQAEVQLLESVYWRLDRKY